jgi:hypothetical protein
LVGQRPIGPETTLIEVFWGLFWIYFICNKIQKPAKSGNNAYVVATIAVPAALRYYHGRDNNRIGPESPLIQVFLQLSRFVPTGTKRRNARAAGCPSPSQLLVDPGLGQGRARLGSRMELSSLGEKRQLTEFAHPPGENPLRNAYMPDPLRRG